ncbi:MAG: hypothetical protein ABJQ29_00490 [Luteolibacter sp.]
MTDAALTAGFLGTLHRRSVHLLVRLGCFLLVATNKRQPVPLLPLRRLPATIKPRIRGLPLTSQRGDNLGGGELGNLVVETHGRILPDKKKYAMQKKELAKCLQCGQSKRMTNTKSTMQNSFWKKVFARVIQTRFFNETFRAANNGIVDKMESWRSDIEKALNYCRQSDDAAYEFYCYEFRHLTPAEQIAISGKTFIEWDVTEKEIKA